MHRGKRLLRVRQLAHLAVERHASMAHPVISHASRVDDEVRRQARIWGYGVRVQVKCGRVLMNDLIFTLLETVCQRAASEGRGARMAGPSTAREHRCESCGRTAKSSAGRHWWRSRPNALAAPQKDVVDLGRPGGPRPIASSATDICVVRDSGRARPPCGPTRPTSTLPPRRALRPAVASRERRRARTSLPM